MSGNVGSHASRNAGLRRTAGQEAQAFLAAAIAAFQRGQHDEARALCRQILRLAPDHFDALHLLGFLQLDGPHADEAERLLRRAVEIQPRSAEAHSNLGLACARLKRFEEARECQEIAIALNANFPTALTNLGIALMRLRLHERAIEAHDNAIRLKPDYADAYSNRGMTQLVLEQTTEADASFERALSLHPRHLAALTGKGMVSINLGDFEAAQRAFDTVLAINPHVAEALAHRGRLKVLLGRADEAEADLDAALAIEPMLECAWEGKIHHGLLTNRIPQATQACDKVLEINPESAKTLGHRGRLKMALGKLDQAEADFDAALAIDPDLEGVWESKAYHGLLANKIAQAIHACHKVLDINPQSEAAIVWLGDCHIEQGNIEAALQLYDRALAIRPDSGEAILKKIFAMDFLPDADFAAHQAVRHEWWERIGAKLPRREMWPASLDPEKRIRVGYVSFDFKRHSVASTFVPILRHHDHRQFEIVAYSCSHLHDSRTEECKALVDVWVDAAGWSDDALADRIERDQVDILVDLSGHSGGNRLAVFARKPAPVQVSACGSVTGTGLPAMDYLLADPVMIPDAARRLFAEQIHDLPCGITIDRAPAMQPTEAPMLRNGFVTFGVFNRLQKISDGALRVWSAILRQIPGSRIVVKNASLDDVLLRDGLIARFSAHGIAADRLSCIGGTSQLQHLAQFAGVDISLDPFPQNGGVSTWESLQMGVPVICKLGQGACSRAGAAIVKAVGLDDWVAEDDDGYVAIARRFAKSPVELNILRAELPARVVNSEAGNNEIYTRRVEDGYRQFWRRYCAAQGPRS